jgi:hypothetical protein
MTTTLFGFPAPEDFGSKLAPNAATIENGTTALCSTWAEAASIALERASAARSARLRAVESGESPMGAESANELKESLLAITSSAYSLESLHNFLVVLNLKGKSSNAPAGKNKCHGLAVFGSLNCAFEIPGDLEEWSNRLWMLFYARNFGVHPKYHHRNLYLHPLGYDTTLIRGMFSLEGAVAAVNLMKEVYSEIVPFPKEPVPKRLSEEISAIHNTLCKVLEG